jgi:hypothetical protein
LNVGLDEQSCEIVNHAVVSGVLLHDHLEKDLVLFFKGFQRIFFLEALLTNGLYAHCLLARGVNLRLALLQNGIQLAAELVDSLDVELGRLREGRVVVHDRLDELLAGRDRAFYLLRIELGPLSVRLGELA